MALAFTSTTGNCGGGHFIVELGHMFDSIISMQNLYTAWREFQNGKRYKDDVAFFARNLDVHIYNLHLDLVSKSYAHSKYVAFKVNDPKPRDIHKASVRDRLLHHAIYRKLYPPFDKKFIYDSYSCRLYKGTHRAIDRFRQFHRKVSHNHSRTCWVLKCDIRKFFANIDHEILKSILRKHITDTDTLWLLEEAINSFSTSSRISAMADMRKVGLPLGNLTSQLLVNVYMNEFDQYVKHVLKVKYYIRYADDFVFLSEDREYLTKILGEVGDFLQTNLKLSLHPDKVFIKTIASGVDFLGWVHFSHHRVLRTATKNRMFRNITKTKSEASLESYRGMLKHGNAHGLEKDLTRMFENK